MDFGDDRCRGCGAAWVGHAGAFACGYPLADCAAALADADEAEAREDQVAWEALFHEAFALGAPRMTQADADVLDDWEEEVFGYAPVAPDPSVVAEVVGDDIPF